VLLSDGEALLVQHISGVARCFYPPLSDTVDQVSAVGAIAFRHVRANRQPDSLSQRVSVIPAMHHLGIARGPNPCIEDDRSSCHGVTRRIALPAIAARRKNLAQLTGGQADGSR